MENLERALSNNDVTIILDQEEWGWLIEMFEYPPEPTQKLRDLMKDHDKRIEDETN